ncbi:MAG: phage tail tube protein [Actinomycetota bacterium]
MPFKHGKFTYFAIATAATPTVPVNISQYCHEVSMPRSAEAAETTVFGTGAKEYVLGLQDGTISFSGKYDPAVDNQLGALLGIEQPVNFEYGPGGNTTGLVKYTGKGIVTSYEVSSPVGDVVTFSAELQISGAVTRATYP